MKVKLYGYREVDMTADDGRRINGVSLYIGYPNDGVVGEQTAKVFINNVLRTSEGFVPHVGDALNIEYGPNGRVVGVSVAK